MSVVLQLQGSGVHIDRAALARIGSRFADSHVAFLPGLIELRWLEFLAPRLEQPMNWCHAVHEGIGTELSLVDRPALHLLHFLSNGADFIQVVRAISGYGELNSFTGRVYRFIPGSDHHDSWHHDMFENRIVGMSVNLGARPYRGGLFQLRDRATRRVLFEIANTGWGDAFLFLISPMLEHQVTRVTGAEAKTAFAGWFSSGAWNHLESLRQRSGMLGDPRTE